MKKKKGNKWRGESNGRAVPGTRAPRKDEAVKATAGKAKAAPADSDSRPADGDLDKPPSGNA